MPSTLNEFLEKALERQKIVNERVDYKSGFSEDDALWKIIKKYWPKETRQLEKGYDEKLKNDLQEKVAGSISRYGFGTRWK